MGSGITCKEWLAEYGERAAIREFDGRLPRIQAEALAFRETVQATGIDRATAREWVRSASPALG